MLNRFLPYLIILVLLFGYSGQVQATKTFGYSLSQENKSKFVEVQQIVPSVVLDIRYATANNFTHSKLYESPAAKLRLGTAEKLKKVAEEIEKKGYRLKIWDAYRSPEVQFALWNLIPDSRFIANPYKGYSSHSRGSAVDLTLIDNQGNELVMPTGFDDFTEHAARVNDNENAKYLKEVMTKNGFKALASEWWHFDDLDTYEPVAIVQKSSQKTINYKVRISVSAIGDVTLGQDERFLYEGSFNQYYTLKGSEYFFSGVKNILAGDDLTIANLEGPLTEATDKPNKSSQGTRAFFFKGNPHYTAILKDGSIEAVNLANNHSMDFLNKGYEDTVATLDHAKISSFGDEKVTVYEKEGVKVGLIGLNTLGPIEEGVNLDNLILQLKTQIETLKEEKTSMIIVSFHWGQENKYFPTQVQRKLGQLAIDQGADLVLGHHPHVIQKYENYKGRCIVYSLGNFVFGGNPNPWYKYTEIFRQQYDFVDGKLVELSSPQIIPCQLSASYRPEPSK
ncbi:CapA family protein [Desulfosporosinus meridiei]|uniref:D-alanyl-D-alanine dipeptidase n=1 Tax=Desulfosporosinus meridiei (strain ATCC BAA-275 / DSM 13257 / KCTC 12902 / NCIMB 13706 / S10) TaxID=768704 RepID=J7IM30_DESMD|nr:CapA family protein [Desulfosporosinus meridiei]AFQ42812.1 D-alanyl-D-alanine dipeptidase [Desulfosporosinus meridiei DSM 13257]